MIKCKFFFLLISLYSTASLGLEKLSIYSGLSSRLDYLESLNLDAYRLNNKSSGSENFITPDGVIILPNKIDNNSSDISWVSKVRDVYQLAIAIGAQELENNVLVSSLNKRFNIIVEGYYPISDEDPSVVMSRFLKFLFFNKNDNFVVKDEFLDALNQLPDEWEKVLGTIRSFYVPLVTLERGQVGEINYFNDKFNIDDIKYIFTLDKNILFNVLKLSRNVLLQYKISEDARLGKHIVYLYGRKSKVKPIDQFDVLITLSQQD